MFESVYFGTIRIEPWEIIVLPFYLLIIYLVANRIKKKRIDENPLYKFYVWGLFAKIIGGIGLVIIYMYWWNGGDTTSYFESSLAMKNLLMSSPVDWFANEFGKNNYDNFSLFSYDTGYPLAYMFFDTKTYMVIRLVNP